MAELIEILTGAGLETEVATTIVEKLTGADEVTTVAAKGMKILVDLKDNPTYIPKSRFDEVIIQKNDFKTQLGELSGKIKDYETASETNKTKLDEYDNLANQYKTLKLETELKKAILPKNPADGTGEDILKFIDTSKIEYNEDGTMKNITELIDGLVETKPYLFSEKGKGKLGNPSNPANNKEVNLPMRDLLADLYKGK